MCLREALDAYEAGAITQDDYLQVITAHCTGLRHGRNGQCNNDTTNGPADEFSFASNLPGNLRNFPFAVGYFIRRYIVKLDRQVQGKSSLMGRILTSADDDDDGVDAEPIRETLRAYLNDDGAAFVRGIASMGAAYDSIPLSQAELDHQAEREARWIRCGLGDSPRPWSFFSEKTTSAALCHLLAITALCDDKADVLRTLFADQQTLAEYEACDDFQRHYGDTAFEGRGLAATKAVRDSGMKILTPEGERPTCHLKWDIL